MIKGAVATVILILVLTGWFQRTYGEKPTKAKWVIPLWGVGGAFVVAIAVSGWWISATRDYDQCMSRVDRSQGSHTQTELLYDVIDQATGTDRYTSTVILPGAPSLRDSLNINLPQLDAASCATLKP